MLHTLRPGPGSRKYRQRVGRGISAGQGKTAGRGTKGQQSRTGKGKRWGFEGGQTPLLRRQPKLGGFLRPGKIVFEILNLDTLEKNLTPGVYDAISLRAKGILRTPRPVKLLGRGTVSKKFTLTVAAASVSAKEAIQKAGGTVEISKLKARGS